MQKIRLREIKKEDKITIFKWSNLKSIRNNSLNKNKISFKNHEKWFNQKLILKKDNIKIVNVTNEDIGLVRIEKKRNLHYLSYFILPKFREKGFGLKSLKIFINFLKQKKKISKIIAKVKKKNYASIKIFRKLNFVENNSRSNIITFEYKI